MQKKTSHFHSSSIISCYQPQIAILGQVSMATKLVTNKSGQKDISDTSKEQLCFTDVSIMRF